MTLTDGYGKTLSFCQVHPLPSGIPIKFKFKAEDCVAKSVLNSHEFAFSSANKMVHKLFVICLLEKFDFTYFTC